MPTVQIKRHPERLSDSGTRPRRLSRRSAISAPSAGSVRSQAKALELIILATATLAIATAWFLPASLVLPSISIAALGLAGLAALAAWRWKGPHNDHSLTLWDAAGLFALVGFGAGMLSEPEAVVQIFARDP